MCQYQSPNANDQKQPPTHPGGWGSHFVTSEGVEASGSEADPYERERARLSRELHDDIAQRVAILSAGLGSLRHRLANASQDVQADVERLSAEVASIGLEVHRIARGLHPAGLETLGLEASIRLFCAQLAEAQHVSIDVDLGPLPAPLAMDAALCLYRITQEALNNVVKHSGASQATVTLRVIGGEIALRIADHGVGFDSETTRTKATLGLVSMRERVALAHGRLSVSSTPGEGTVIEVRVPMPPSSMCPRHL